MAQRNRCIQTQFMGKRLGQGYAPQAGGSPPVTTPPAVGGTLAFIQNGANTASLTVACTVNAGNNRAILVGVVTGIATNAAPTGVTYNGVPLTKIADAYGAGPYFGVSLWIGLAPAVGTANVVATLAKSTEVAAMWAQPLINVNQATPIGTPVSNISPSGGNANPYVLPMSIPTAENDLAVICGLASKDAHTNVMSIPDEAGTTYVVKNVRDTVRYNWSFGQFIGKTALAGANTDYALTLTGGATYESVSCGIAIKAA